MTLRSLISVRNMTLEPLMGVPETKAQLSEVGIDNSELRVTAVCISRDSETWDFEDVPFYNFTDGWKPFKHEPTFERVDYLAQRRNAAVRQALILFPRTEHILMIDSYYLHQLRQIQGVVREYVKMLQSDYKEGCILGASTWIYDKTRVKPRLRFYDWWTTPEAAELKLDEVEKNGTIMKVSAVGACYLYPRWVWGKTGYGVPEGVKGCEHNWLCERSGLPVFLSLDQRLWRDPIVYPWLKRVRVSLHLGRFLSKRRFSLYAQPRGFD